MDNYLRNQAGQDARRKVAAPFVTELRDWSVLGYYTLSAYSVRAAELPEAVAKKLMDALYRSWRNTSEVASVGVVVDALDEPVREFYIHHEFQSLSDHPAKLFLAMLTIEKAFKG